MPINIKVTIYSTFIQYTYILFNTTIDQRYEFRYHETYFIGHSLYLVCIVSAKIRGNILINKSCKGIRLQFIFKKYEGCNSHRRKQVL